MFTMCNAACWDTATARRHWTEQWRHDQVRRRPLPNRTEFINFSEEALINDDTSCCSHTFFSNWLAVPCFSFWKAFVKCPSLSVNGIFDDVRYHEIWRHLHVTMLQCWAKFSNVLIRRSIRMNRKTMCKCVKVMPRILWLRFSRHGVYDLRTYRSKPIWTGRL